MQLTRHLLVMKHFLLAALSLLAIGLLTAGGTPNMTMASTQHALHTPLQKYQLLSLTQQQELHQSLRATYPNPTDQSGLPASVRVTTTGETVRLSASVSQGTQIYECQTSTTTAGSFTWNLQAPFAFLKATNGTNVIHSTGPTWLYTLDESIIEGAVGTFTSANGSSSPASATPNAKSIPWLRLNIISHQGKTGLFSNVDQVQRIYTVGGIAPSTGCNQTTAKQHVIQSVPYTAEYVFWGHRS
jgi:hypothetical protein